MESAPTSEESEVEEVQPQVQGRRVRRRPAKAEPLGSTKVEDPEADMTNALARAVGIQDPEPVGAAEQMLGSMK